MKRFIKITTIISLCLILAGIGLAGCGFMLGGIPDFQYNLDNHKVDTKRSSAKLITEELASFDNINLDIINADISLHYGDNYSISYYTDTLSKKEFKVSDGTLTVHSNADSQSHIINFTPFSINDSLSDIVITVPKNKKLQDITIANNSGDFDLSDIKCDTLSLDFDYGDVRIHNVTANESDITLQSGNLSLNKGKIESCNMELGYGDVALKKTTIQTLSCTCNSGDFTADDYQSEENIITLNYGDLDITTSTLSMLKANLDSGDCELNLSGNPEDYELTLTASSGDIHVNDSEYDNNYISKFKSSSASSKLIQVNTSYGDIDVDLK